MDDWYKIFLKHFRLEGKDSVNNLLGYNHYKSTLFIFTVLWKKFVFF